MDSKICGQLLYWILILIAIAALIASYQQIRKYRRWLLPLRYFYVDRKYALVPCYTEFVCVCYGVAVNVGNTTYSGTLTNITG